MNLPEVILIGDLELLFLGLALGAGAPKAARRILRRRYGAGASGKASAECDDCPKPVDCAALGCRKER